MGFHGVLDGVEPRCMRRSISSRPGRWQSDDGAISREASGIPLPDGYNGLVRRRCLQRQAGMFPSAHVAIQVAYIGVAGLPQGKSRDDGARSVLAVNDHWPVPGCSEVIRQEERLPERHVNRTRYMSFPVLIGRTHIDNHRRSAGLYPLFKIGGGYVCRQIHITSSRRARQQHQSGREDNAKKLINRMLPHDFLQYIPVIQA
jgi:hypothetical protein